MKGLDQYRSLILFISIFGIADKRRKKEQCNGRYTHELHKL